MASHRADRSGKASRRAFLRHVTLAGGALTLAPLVAACAGSGPIPTPAQTPTEAPKPTAAPQVRQPNETDIPKPTEAPSPTSVPQVRQPNETEVPRPTVTPTPAGPKTVRIGMSQEPDNLVLWPGGMYVTGVVQNLLFRSLVGVDDQMRPYADLAETVPTVENGGARYVGDGETKQLQVTLKLRKGVRWSNGDPLTSADVRFTWEMMLNPDSGATIDTEAKYEKVETPDDQTVVFTFFSEKSARAAAAKDKATYGDLAGQRGPVLDPLYVFGLPNSFIYPSRVLGPQLDNSPRSSSKIRDVLSRSDFVSKPVTSGPYVLKEQIAGASITLTARPDYFRGAPKIQNVVFSIVPRTEVLIAQLKAGQLDLVTQDALDVKDSPVLDTIPGVTAYYVPGTAWEHLDLNLDNPALKDKAVRKALFYATDRQELIDKVFLGKTKPVNAPIMDWSWAYNKAVPVYSYDAKQAEALLDGAGWKKGSDGIRAKDGKRLALKYVATDSPARRAVAPLLKAQWKLVGVDLAVEHVPSKAYFDKQSGPLSTRAFEVAEYAWIGGYDPGADAQFSYSSVYIPSKDNGYTGGNYPGYRNPDSDRLLAQGLATLDQAARTAIYQQWQLLVVEDLPTLPLFARPSTTAATTRLKNLRPPMHSGGETWNVEEWDLE